MKFLGLLLVFSCAGFVGCNPVDPPIDPPVDVSDARGAVYGYTWGDGKLQDDGRFFFGTKSERKQDRFRAALTDADIDFVENSGDSSWVQFKFVLGGFDETFFASIPEGVYDVEAFVAGVVESEGVKSTGLVLDDGLKARLDSFDALMQEQGFVTRRSPRKVFVEPESYELFEDGYPFVVCTRVPGDLAC